MDGFSSEYPILIAQAGPLNGQRWTVNQTLMIGREPTCQVVVPDRQVSRYHARLIPAEGGVVLEDLSSKNGTFHNGQFLAEAVDLQDGDTIQIALAQYFIFLSSDATMPLEGGVAAQAAPQAAAVPNNPRLHLDVRSRQVWVLDQELVPPLSAPQFRMLQILFENVQRVVSREELVDAIWGGEQAEGVSEQALDALVRRLRDRLAAVDPEHAYILTVRGHGIRLDNPAS